MKRRWLLSLAALLAVLAGAAFLSGIPRTSERAPGAEGISGGELSPGPQIVLRNVEMREVRKGEAAYRLLSDVVTYRVLSEDLSAAGVTLLLPGQRGEVVVRAPEARWDMRTGRIVLPSGGSAEDRGGWIASVAFARLSLPERTFTAPGDANLSGPGLAVAGDNLVWRWREGKVELERPKTRVLPARALRRKG
ncbi:MAG: hypothetical protein HZB63_01120 [Deltaproteobacteria bacterium]|nr:hypothetical protein [Deltaproteobacteria bacterium]